ncbi:MAG: PorP/SprF family type IX secretion system membrane protein [Bacteroidia bacterium]|nr:PorP/SprF family type IX secretion system membrane protein [Bacteroidia bacterium]
MGVENYKMTLKPLSLLSMAALGLMMVSRVNAQQDPYYTHYNFVRPLYNPAAIGLDGKWCAFGISHSQYMGLEDRTPLYETPNNPKMQAVPGVGPKTNGAGVSIPINKFNRSTGESKNYGGAGLIFYNDRLGYEVNNVVRGQLAYRYFMDEESSIALGVDVGYLQKGLDGAKLRAIDPNDPFIPTGLESDGGVTASFGLFYNNQRFNNLIVGLSSTNLLPHDYRFGANGNVFSRTARHYYMLGSMEFTNFIGNPALTLMPSVLFKYNAKFQADATALVEYMETISGGLGYRSISDALSLMFGYKYKGVRVGLSYDVTLSRLRKVSNGTFEIVANYCWVIVPPPPPGIIPILTPLWIDRESSQE